MKAKAYPLRAHLFCIIAVMLIPALMLTGFVLRDLYRTGVSQAERDAREISRRLSAVVDREIVSISLALQVLSTSRLFSERRFEDLQKQALEIKDIVKADIIIKDATGQQLVNTRLAWGSPLPISLPEADQLALTKGVPTISDVFMGATSRSPIVSINVPIIRGGEVSGLVNTGLDPARLSALLAAGGLPPDWTAAVVDRKGLIVARSRQAERFVGTVASDDLRQNAVGEEGTWVGSTADGQPVLAGYTRSDFTGWRTAVGVPKQIAEQPLWRSLKWAGISTAIGLIVVLLIVNRLSQPITRSIDILAQAATNLGRGTEVRATPTSIHELGILSAELQTASSKLRAHQETLESQVAERTKQLSEANERLVSEIRMREEAEAQLRQSQKLEAIGQLTGGLAHDFNNLLTIIGGSLQMLRSRLNPDEVGPLRRYMDAASEGVTKAATLTHRLLAFGRQQPLAPQAVDVNQLVQDISDLLHRTLGEQAKIEIVLGAHPAKTHVDPNQLENAILNLALNARDAMPDGGRLTIETANVELDQRYSDANSNAPVGPFIMVAVSDTGFGMKPDVVSKAFDPFFTTKPTGQGTGLGLSQVYGFVKQSGGHAKIYSEAGGGTSVKLYLPIVLGKTEPESTETLTRSPTNEKAFSGATILVVEDDEGVRQLSLDYLAELGFATLEAEGGAAALRLLDNNLDVDLLFTDVVMPDMNGDRLAEEALRRRPGLPVLFTSGYTRNAIVHGGVIEPGLHLLPKPFTIEQLKEKVIEILSVRKMNLTK